MMTKSTMSSIRVSQGSIKNANHTLEKQETAANPSKTKAFGDIVSQRMNSKNSNNSSSTVEKYGETSSVKSSSRTEEALKAVQTGDVASKLKPYEQAVDNNNKDNQEEEALTGTNGFDEEELAQISELAASLYGIATYSGVDENEKYLKMSNMLNQALAEIKTNIFNNNKAGRIMMQKFNGFLELLQSDKSTAAIGATDRADLTNLLSKLMGSYSELQDNLASAEGDQIEAVRSICKQLLVLLDDLTGRENTEDTKAKGYEEASMTALLQMITNKMNQLMKAKPESQPLPSKIEIADNLVDMINILKMLLDEQAKNINTTDQSLIRAMLDDGKPQFDTVMKEFGVGNLNSDAKANEATIIEFKKQVVSTLLMLVNKNDAGNDSVTSNGTDSSLVMEDKKNNDIMPGKNTVIKFVKELEARIKEMDKSISQANIPAKSPDIGTASHEEKLLKKILSNENSGEDSKINRVSNLVSQLGNTKNDMDLTKINEKPVITKANFTQDIIKTVRHMALNNLEQLTVKIAPKELGEITIKITMTDGNMKANITANTKEAFLLLTSNAGEMKSSLENNTIKIQNVDINLYQEDASFNSNNHSRNENNQSGRHRNTSPQSQNDHQEIFEKTIEDDSNISILI